ncbi:uncharacterized protein LOC114358008, partial [Ostrinia furnacalis]|uniref:uncharacterized protein LOC114358008 n=1 Tax=Ostrinia furnacalis TaxID=93504 RepID=UPI00103FD83B
MNCTKFFYVLIVAASLRSVHNFLVTRFKNPHEYVARDDLSVLDSLDDATYQHLLQELPILEKYAKRRRPEFIEDEDNEENEEFEYYHDQDDQEEWTNVNLEEYSQQRNNQAVNLTTTTQLPKLPFITRWPNPSTHRQPKVAAQTNDSRKSFLSWLSPYQGPRVARCFWCGLNQSRIPRSPLCHDMFETQDFRARTLARFFRAHCHENKFHIANRKKPFQYYSGGPTHRYAPGLISQFYGPFTGGCFKRFLDVGTVYTQRGCRAWWPRMSWGAPRSFAAHRFAAMEIPLRKFKKDICLISPHASLTPFHRGISLYVRYHVCICFKKWCNGV